MKKVTKFFEANPLFCMVACLLLMLVSVFIGGGAMAEALVTDPNPDAPTPDIHGADNSGASPDGNGAGRQLPGSTASASAEREGGLLLPDYDPDIVRFKCNQFVLLNGARTIATQRPVKDYVAPHFQIGEQNLSATLKVKKDAGATVKFGTDDIEGVVSAFYPGSTVTFKGVNGYKDGSQTETDGDLQGYVMSNDGDEVTLRPLNGKTKTAGKTSVYLTDYTFPDIPANTEIVIEAIAGHETQMIVDPDNSQQQPVEVFLQKQIFNVRLTKHEQDVLKKTKWGLQEIKDQALNTFSRKAEFTLWNGVQKHFKVKVDKSGEEDVFTSQGVLRQLTNTYSLMDGKIKFEDITNIGKIQFTKFAENDDADAYCGRDMLADIINMDYVKHKDITFTQHTTDYGVIVRDMVNNFGTLHVKYAPALDELGYEKFMVVLDMKSARYYTYIQKKEYNIDNTKNGDNATESMRYVYIEASALALRGYNSMLVGPAELIAKKNIASNSNPINVGKELPANPANGQKILLESDYTDAAGKTYDAGKVYQWNGTAWAVFSGTVEG